VGLEAFGSAYGKECSRAPELAPTHVTATNTRHRHTHTHTHTVRREARWDRS